ncbi:MAG: FG-GAP-like repeat-containing protein, partial [bacterium]
MIKKTFFLLSSLFILTPHIVLGYIWPVPGTTTQHPITGTLGEYRTDPLHFHAGVDIGEGAGTNVYPAVSGIIGEIVEGGNGRVVVNGDDGRAYTYRHMDPENNLHVNDPVIAGQTLLGVIGNVLVHPHLHFEEDDGDYNPLRSNGLSPFTDNANPTVTSFTLYRDRTNTQITGNILWNRIDIKADAFDPRTDSNGNSAGHRCSVYKIYAEFLQDGSTIGNKIEYIKFDSKPDNDNFELIYDGQSSTGFYYWVTNDPFAAGTPTANKYWNTKWDKNGDIDNDPATYNDAQTNYEAMYPDGSYTIKVIAEDIRSNSANQTRDVILDNFAPMVKRVKILQGMQLLYDSNDSNYRYPVGSGATKFVIQFSESMKTCITPTVTFGLTSPYAQYSVTPIDTPWSKSDFLNDTWVGICQIPKEMTIGEYTLSIDAKDLAENRLDTTLPMGTRTDSGSWSNYEPGKNTDYKFNIAYSTDLYPFNLNNITLGTSTEVYYEFLIDPKIPVSDNYAQMIKIKLEGLNIKGSVIKRTIYEFIESQILFKNEAKEKGEIIIKGLGIDYGRMVVIITNPSVDTSYRFNLYVHTAKVRYKSHYPQDPIPDKSIEFKVKELPDKAPQSLRSWEFWGNGDGDVDAGETPVLQTILKNYGSMLLHLGETIATITTKDAMTEKYTGIVNNQTSFSKMEPYGGEGENSPGYIIKVDEDCPFNQILNFKLDIIDEYGINYEDSLIVDKVGMDLRLKFDKGVTTEDDFYKNNNGNVDAGELVSTEVYLLQIGYTNIRQIYEDCPNYSHKLKGKLSSDSFYVKRIIDDTATDFTDLTGIYKQGYSKKDALTLISSDCPPNTEIPFNIAITDRVTDVNGTPYDFGTWTETGVLKIKVMGKDTLAPLVNKIGISSSTPNPILGDGDYIYFDVDLLDGSNKLTGTSNLNTPAQTILPIYIGQGTKRADVGNFETYRFNYLILPGLKDGEYKIVELKIDDSYGNISEPKPVNVNVEIDTEPPVVEIGSLTSDIFAGTVYNDAGYQLLTGTITISGRTWDKHFGTYTLEYAQGINPALDWKLIVSSTLAQKDMGTLATWNTLPLPDGTYTLRLTATDLVNHSSVMTKIIEIDNTNPTAIITQPGFSQAIALPEVDICGTAWDKNFKEFKLKYCQGILNEHNPNPTWYEIITKDTSVINGTLTNWNTSNLVDGGIYTLELTVTDKLEHQNRQIRAVRVDTTGPEITLAENIKTNVIGYNISEAGMVTINIYQVNPLEYPDIESFFQDTPPYGPVWDWTEEVHLGENEVIWSGKDKDNIELPDSGTYTAYYLSLKGVDEASKESKLAYSQILKKGLPKIDSLTLPLEFDFQTNPMLNFSFLSEVATELEAIVVNDEGKLTQILGSPTTSGNNHEITYQYGWDGRNIYGFMVLSGRYTLKIKLKDVDGNVVFWDGIKENRFIQITTPPLPPIIDYGSPTYRSTPPIPVTNSNPIIQIEKKVIFPTVPIYGSQDIVSGNLTRFAWVFPIKCMEFIEMATNTCNSNAYIWDGRDIPPGKGDGSGRREASIASAGLFPTGDYDYVNYNNKLEYATHSQVTLATDTLPVKIKGVCEIDTPPDNPIFDLDMTLDGYIKGYLLCVYDSQENLIGTAGLNPLPPQQEFGTWGDGSADIEKRNWTKMVDKITYQSPLNLNAGKYIVELTSLDIAGNATKSVKEVSYQRPILAEIGGTVIGDIGSDTSIKSIELVIPPQILQEINWATSTIQITPATSTPELEPFFDYLDKIYNVAPKGLKFSPAATLRLSYLDFNNNELIETDQTYDGIIGVQMDADPEIEGVKIETGEIVSQNYGVNEEQNIKVEQLGIFYLSDHGVPEYIGGIVDRQNKTIEAKIEHTSDYAALVKKDTTPPVTTIELNGIVYNGSYTLSSSTFSLTAIDPMGTTGEVISGVAKIKYGIDNPEPDIIYIEPFSLRPGEHTIYYQAVDNAGNAEEIKNFKIHIVENLLIDAKMDLVDVYVGSVAWGDYDNDGDLDLALTGCLESGEGISKIYKNESGKLIEDPSQDLIGVEDSSIAWGDYDNDGDLDLALTGWNYSNGIISKIYKNESGRLIEDTSQHLIGVTNSSIAWGDYDNDGDLDLALTGWNYSNGIISKIYKNESGRLIEDTSQHLIEVINSSIAWGDYDNDGDLDLALTGYNWFNNISKIYKNESGKLIEDTSQDLIGVQGSFIAWGDYDNDGDLDLVLTGRTILTEHISKIYKNESGKLIEDINQKLPGVGASSIAWGDYDNDGDLDLAVTGLTQSKEHISKIYKNASGKLIEDTFQNLIGVMTSSIAWGDIDCDGNLDLVLTGLIISPKEIMDLLDLLRTEGNKDITLSTGLYAVSNLYKNYGVKSNNLPSPPTQFSSSYSNGKLTFSWNAGSDKETTEKGLYYNIRVGTAPGKEDVVAGKYGSPLFGNYLLKQKSLTLNLPPGTYYWAVQAIDTGLAASQWSAEQVAVTANITLVSPHSGTVGTKVTIKGEGYLQTELIRIDFGTIMSIAMATTDAFGSFGCNFTVQTQPFGIYTISATGSVFSACASFFIRGNIVLVSPTSGLRGTNVTISGNGYSAIEDIVVDFGTTKTIADCVSSGVGSFSTIFTVDVQSAGTTTILVRGIDSNEVCYSYFVITLKPGITLVSPAMGTVGSIVKIAGAGFDLNEGIGIDFGKSLTIATTTADNSGAFSSSFKVDTQGYGTTTIVTRGLTSGQNALDTFIIRGNIVLVTPVSGLIGTKVTVVGNGFAASEKVTIGFGMNPTIATVLSTAQGTFTTTFTADTQPGCGTITVSAKGRDCVAYSWFRMLGRITAVSPQQGTIGTAVTVRGDGFAASELICIDFGTNPTITTTISDYLGRFITVFTADTQPGCGTITVSAKGKDCVAYSWFRMLGRITTVSPQQGTIGTAVTVRGDGFAASELICIDFGTNPTITTTISDYLGRFIAVFTADTQPGCGTITVSAKGKDCVAYSWFRMLGRITAVSPQQGTIGTAVTVRGDGFAASELICIDFGTNPTITTTISDYLGRFIAVFTADTQPGCGTITVSAKGKDCVAYSWFRMLGRITAVSPQQGTIGTAVTVRGDGFAASELICIDFGTNPTIAVILSDGLGRFTAVFTADTQPGCGTITVSAKGRDCVAYSWFRMLGRITAVSPQQGTIGTAVTVRGDGFAASELICIDFGTNPTIAVTLSDGLGRFTAVFTADTQPGGGTITVSAKGKDCAAYSWFRMLGRITAVSPQQGTIGTAVTVRGDGFAASELICIDFG